VDDADERGIDAVLPSQVVGHEIGHGDDPVGTDHCGVASTVQGTVERVDVMDGGDERGAGLACRDAAAPRRRRGARVHEVEPMPADRARQPAAVAPSREPARAVEREADVRRPRRRELALQPAAGRRHHRTPAVRAQVPGHVDGAPTDLVRLQPRQHLQDRGCAVVISDDGVRHGREPGYRVRRIGKALAMGQLRVELPAMGEGLRSVA
jgi:hypothetical protein